MLELILLAAALVRDHPADFKAGWEKAKARTLLRERYRHGLIDAATMMEEEVKYLTPQEAAAFWKVAREELERSEARARQREEALKRAVEAVERWKARNRVGPPPPPDVK
jgi:hypothetical protein